MADVAFLVPSVGISGGVATIFEHGLQLAEAGHSVSFLTRRPIVERDIQWHRVARDRPEGLRWLTISQASGHRFGVAIATYWDTFFDLWKVDASQYLYFVQSVESRFPAPEDLVVRSLIESTYEVDVGVITEARWIADYMRRIHGRVADIAPNGVDKAAFRVEGPASAAPLRGGLRALVEGPVDVAFKNVPKAIDLCRRAGVDEVWLLTSSPIATCLGADRVFSGVPMERVGEIYRSCDVLLKLSHVEGMFGPPLEMFHCGGTCVVYDVTGHEEYVVHGVNGLVAKTDDDEAVLRYMRQLRQEPSFLAMLRANAAKTAAAWPDWPTSSRRFAEAMTTAAERATIGRDALRTYASRMWHSYESSRREIALRDAMPVTSGSASDARSRPAYDAGASTSAIWTSWEMALYRDILRSSSWRIASAIMSAFGIDHLRALRARESIESRRDLHPHSRADLHDRICALYGSTAWGALAPLRLASRMRKRLAR